MYLFRLDQIELVARSGECQSEREGPRIGGWQKKRESEAVEKCCQFWLQSDAIALNICIKRDVNLDFDFLIIACELRFVARSREKGADTYGRFTI